MMLMTKFGKFKLRLIATINMSVLLSLFNIAATSSSYWVKYLDPETEQSHFAGLWRSCQVNQDEEMGGWPCGWKSGIVHHQLSIWSLLVRLFLTVGTVLNCAVVLFYLAAFACKMNKKSKRAIKLMEWANLMLVIAFCVLLCGFGLFISNSSNFSVWLWIISLVFIVITSNLLTRKFAVLYFQNTRALKMSQNSKTCSETPCNPEEKIALAPISNSEKCTETTPQETSDAVTNTDQQTTDKETAKDSVITTTANETQKTAEEVSGSNEALIPPSAPPKVPDTQTKTETEEIETKKEMSAAELA